VLLSYGSDLQELIRRGAAVADRILNGAKPAKALHLTSPGSLLARADQLIE